MKLKYYLIASPENHYQPWILGKTAMACFVLGIWVLRAFVPSYLPNAGAASGIDSTDLMTRINAERTQRFLPALITNSKLIAAANIKSQDMLDRSYFAHVDPDGNYVWPTIEAQGYKPYKALGENLAIDFTSADSVVTAWMNSPGHRANILNEKFEDQGMAAIYGEYEPGHYTYTITNLFGTLIKSSTPTPTPTPTPTQSPSPTQPTPTPAVKSGSTQVTPTPTPTITPTDIPVSASTDNNTPGASQTDKNSGVTQISGNPTESSSKSDGLTTLKIILGIFAAVYAVFLLIDSIIIHRAKIARENLSSSPHALMMLLVVFVNFITIWM